ncbi:polysaccharide biosynthesis/export family protein, partial [Helicobacter canadensis]
MKRLFQILLITIFTAHFTYGVDISSITSIPSTSATQNIPMDLQTINPNTTPNTSIQTMQTTQTPILPPVFGANLFNGNFTKVSQSLYNPDYKIAIGDKINFRMWGAVEFQQELMVDSQGNVFVPGVGAINLLGVRNGDLVKVLKQGISKIYKKNVFVYADMNVYQNVSVFVTGSVNKPGLYQGLSSDSIIQYLDKASGINLDYGSFRNIEILRDNKVALQVDLYDFLFSGKMKLFPFRTGDVILVKNLESYVFVQGDVQKPFRFELKDDIKTLEDLARVSGAKPIVTNAIVRSYLANNKIDINSYKQK